MAACLSWFVGHDVNMITSPICKLTTTTLIKSKDYSGLLQLIFIIIALSIMSISNNNMGVNIWYLETSIKGRNTIRLSYLEEKRVWTVKLQPKLIMPSPSAWPPNKVDKLFVYCLIVWLLVFLDWFIFCDVGVFTGLINLQFRVQCCYCRYWTGKTAKIRPKLWYTDINQFPSTDQIL